MVVAKALLELLWELRGTRMAATLLRGRNLLLPFSGQRCCSAGLLSKEAFPVHCTMLPASVLEVSLLGAMVAAHSVTRC